MTTYQRGVASAKGGEPGPPFPKADASWEERLFERGWSDTRAALTTPAPAQPIEHASLSGGYAVAADDAPAQPSEVERLKDILDTERYKVAAGLQAVARAVQGRKWLSEPGRGSYTYDDERYQAEFGAALDEIDAALEPLRKIASDWSDCPRDPLRVAANRKAALANPHPTIGEKGEDPAPPA